MKHKHVRLISWFILCLFITPSISFGANGYFLHGNGPVNESLGGAAIAGNPMDLIGSLNRNPANGTLFDKNIFSLSLEVVLPEMEIESSVDLLSLDDSSDSEVDTITAANIGMVFRKTNQPLAYYFEIIAESGLHLEISESQTNPIFVAQKGKANNPYGGLFGGFGSLETQMEVIRIPFGVSYNYNKKWSVGFALAPSIARLMFTPAAFAAPDDANADNIPTYPDDIDHDISLGFGFQAGFRYTITNQANIGFAMSTPTWFEEFEWKTKDEVGNRRKVSFQIDRPLTAHLGANYQFSSATLFLIDLSWINFSDTKGFDETGFSPEGALKGLGFDDIFVLAFGIQHPFSETFTLRGGYNYCTNPIDEDITFFNVGSPLHTQHHLSVGLSWRMTNQTMVDLSYTHALESSQSGPMYDPNEVPGTKVESKLSYNHIAVGVTISY